MIAKSNAKLRVALLLSIGTVLHAQTTGIDERAPAWRYQVPTNPPADTRTPPQIGPDDAYFDSSAGDVGPLDKPQQYGIGQSGPGVIDEDFPSRFRREIFVAHFTTWDTHWSSSRRSIYTSVPLVVDRVVADLDKQFTRGSTIPLYVPGGTILNPDTGRKISYFIRLYDFPLEPNTEYLIFLQRHPQLNFYQYVKAWRIDSGRLAPVGPYDIWRAESGRSPHSGTSLDSAVSELTRRPNF